MQFSRRLDEVKPSATLAITSKGKALKKEGKDVVILAAGEPDFDTPQAVKDAGIKAINDGSTRYTPSGGTVELKKAIQCKLKKENVLDYALDEIVVSCGAKHSLYNIFQAICDPGDEVIIITPYWLSYPEMVRLAGGTPVVAQAKKENGYKISALELESLMTDKTKAIVLNSPSNPSGVVYEKDELSSISDLCLKKGIKVISDEIYEKIIFEGKKHISIASLSEESKKNTILVNGVSKSYAMTGWRIGYIATESDLVKKIVTLQSHSTSNPCSVSQKAAEAALSLDLTDILESNRASFEKRRDLLFDLLTPIKGLVPYKPLGAFYMYCNIKGTGLSSFEFANKLLEEKLVVVIPGEPFGDDESVRISFASSEEALKEGAKRISDWLGVKT
jgi:aspartate aminotransferase